MKKLLSIFMVICILAMTMCGVVMAEGEETEGTPADGINLSRDSGTQAEAQDHQSSYVAANAIDGSQDTKWQAYRSKNNGGYDNIWLKVSFEKLAQINKVVFYTPVSTSENSWKVYYSLTGEEDSWAEATNLDETQGTTSPFQFTVTMDEAVLAKYVKVVRAGNATTIAITELEIYGEFIEAKFPYLSSLTATGGTFTTTFDKEVFSYQLQVEDFATLPTLTPVTFVGDASAEITQVANADNDYTANITVTHQGESNVYSVQYIPYNWALSVNGAVATADRENLPASNAIDGKVNTMWQSYLGAPKDTDVRFITVELQNPILIDKIVFTNTKSGKLTTSLDKAWSVYCAASADGPWTNITGKFEKIGSNPNVLEGILSPAAGAKFVKFQYDGVTQSVLMSEVEVYGKKITEDFTVSSAISSNNEFVGNVTYLNKTANNVNDKFYLMATYVDGELYNVTPANKSAETIAAGGLSNTSITSAVLPATGTVMAKLFVWSTPTELIPITLPILFN